MTDAIDEQPLDCPYCGETVTILIDTSAGSQRYIEDCSVCCRPMTIEVEIEGGVVRSVRAAREDD